MLKDTMDTNKKIRRLDKRFSYIGLSPILCAARPYLS